MPTATASRCIATTARSCCIPSVAWFGWKRRSGSGWCRRGAASGYRTLFIDPLARADLPSSCQIVQISPLLRELIVASLALTERYYPGTRDERIYELILDEIRGMTVLPFGLPEPHAEGLRRLCQRVREAPGEPWASHQAAQASGMSERTLNRHFQQQTSLTWSEWVRRAKLMEALVRLAQGQSVLRVALDLGYGSHSAFSAMFRRVMGTAPSDYFRQSD